MERPDLVDMEGALEDLYYTEKEWSKATGHGPVADLESHQVALLHRHWLWANAAMRWFEREFAARDENKELAAVERLHEEWAAAMYVCYSLLWSLIEGTRKRQVTIKGAFARDIRAVAEPLREGRNAVFHVGGQEGYYDMRLFEVMEDPNSVRMIHRVHKGFARLLLEEMQRRTSNV